MKKVSFLLLILLFHTAKSQTSLIENYIGVWSGTLQLYNNVKNTGSVPIELTIAKTDDPKTWIWKTAYLSEKTPMTKDYKLKLIDLEKNIYAIDEGNGVILNNFLFDKKMYCLFETETIYLTATYEFFDDKIIFELTSSKKEKTTNSITNFNVSHLQKAILLKKGN
jgi:hypothetical protein